MKLSNVVPRFVEFIPTQLENGVLYVSEKYQTAIHKCCCGCGQEVVTPLSPAQWQIRVVQGKVSLYPSIGNWNSNCKSHYWIRRNQIMWAGNMTQREIERVQERDRRDLQSFTEFTNRQKDVKPERQAHPNDSKSEVTVGILNRLWNWIVSK